MDGDTYQITNPGAIIDLIVDQKMDARVGIGNSFTGRADKLSAGGRWFDKHSIVTNHSEEHAVAVEPVLAEHFFGQNLAGGSQLVHDEVSGLLL